MMDNIVEENYIIFDLDLNKTRGLNDIYDLNQNEFMKNVQFPQNPMKQLHKRYLWILQLKNELISKLIAGNADNLFQENKS